MKILLYCCLVTSLLCHSPATADNGVEEFDDAARYAIEGKVYPPELYGGDSELGWQLDTQISINGGEYKGFLREDGTFQISSVPSGSYVVEIVNPDYYYEPVRVEINPKGKFRARKLNYVQPSQVLQLPYPLKLKALTRFRYFQQREQWKITDFLFNPMVLMMILPLGIMLILPKIMSDPETKKEMENLNLSKMTNDLPEFSEMLTSYFTSGSAGAAAAAAKAGKEKDKAKPKQNKKKN